MAQRNGRRLVVHPRCAAYVAGYRDALRQARAEMGAAHFETLTELNRLRIELTECRAMFDELRAASLARAKAHAELTSLYRERAIQRAHHAERDPAAPLQ